MAADLVVVGTATIRPPVGFADVYEVRVTRVVRGGPVPPILTLTVLAGDEQHASFMSTHLGPGEIELGFVKHQDDEPYRFAPISGFVDDGRTSWLLQSAGEPH